MSKSSFDHFFSAWKGLDEYLGEIAKDLEEEEYQQKISLIVSLLREARSRQIQIVLLGVGRDGKILEMFGTRLTQIGFSRGQIKTVTEEGPSTFIPSTESLAICMSGRGFTSPTVDMAKALKDEGAKLVLITSNKDCEMAKSSDIALFIRGLTDFEFGLSRHDYGADQSMRFDPKKGHFPPTLFEVATLHVLECIVSSLYLEMRHGEKST